MDQLDTLTQINLDDLIASVGGQASPAWSHVLRSLFYRPAQGFARQMVEFDSAVGSHGLAEAARLTLRKYVRELRVFHRERIPTGPFLALANHPGLTDTLALFSALDRGDLKIIALQRPFLEALPYVEKQLFYIREDQASRFSLIRQVSAHLHSGGAVLTFPAGHIEPDPERYPGALDSLKEWTDSAGVFLRFAVETAILPVLVSGVVWKKAAYNPLTKIMRGFEARNRLTAALQLLLQVLGGVKPVTVSVQIGRPIYAGSLGSTNTQVIHQAVLMEMKQLIEGPPGGRGENLL